MDFIKSQTVTLVPKNDPPRTRTWNLRLRRPTPYPLGQQAFVISHVVYTSGYIVIIRYLDKHDNLAEWSKALASGASPQGRGFEPHSCQCSTSSTYHIVEVQNVLG